jgi:hypothetical protein
MELALVVLRQRLRHLFFRLWLARELDKFRSTQPLLRAVFVEYEDI